VRRSTKLIVSKLVTGSVTTAFRRTNICMVGSHLRTRISESRPVFERRTVARVTTAHEYVTCMWTTFFDAASS
jgi:hypothetical protein